MTSEITTTTTTTTTAPFAEVCTPLRQADGRYTVTIAPTWTIGSKVHGGTLVAATAAAGLAELRGAIDDFDMFPVAAGTDFHSAPDPGEVALEVTLRKTGRQVCLADVLLSQNQRVVVRTALTFGHLDEEVVHQAENLTAVGAFADMPVEPPADALFYDARSAAAGVGMGRIVHLARGCDLRIEPATAAFLRGETAEPQLRLWARPFQGDAARPDVAAFFAMMTGDVSPPVTMNRGHVGWTPTVTLTTYLRRRPAPGWLRVVSSARSIGSRMFDEDHLVVDSTGAVTTQSRQLALIPK